jgi:hypothetical protein
VEASARARHKAASPTSRRTRLFEPAATHPPQVVDGTDMSELQASAGNQAVISLLANPGAFPLLIARQATTASSPTGAAPGAASPTAPLPAAPAPTLDLPPEQRPVLQAGSTGEWVKALQTKLQATRGRTGLVVSGTFDSATRKAVVEVQQMLGAKPDGIVGPKTWEAIDNVSGGAAFSADSFKVLHDKAMAAVTLADAGQFGPALAGFKEVYADPNMTAKPELRTTVVLEIGRCEHGLGNFGAAIARYQEAASTPGADSLDKMLASEWTREASLGQPPSTREAIVTRSQQPQPAAPAKPTGA